jgi:hypothetical protein
MSWRRIIEIAEPVHGGKCCQYRASQKTCIDRSSTGT